MFAKLQRPTAGSYAQTPQKIGASMVSALQANPAQQEAANQQSAGDQSDDQTDNQRKGFLAVEAKSQSVPHTAPQFPMQPSNVPEGQMQTTGAEQQAMEMNAPINDQTPWVSSAGPNAWKQTQAPPPEISKRFAGGYFNQWQPGNIWDQAKNNAEYQMPFNVNLKR